jgi:small subunit ribosomal protein S3
MGNRTNPIAMRIGINKNWKSIWYKNKSDYADTVLEDQVLRSKIEESLKNAGVAEVVIKRSMSKIAVDVKVARPGVVIGKGGEGIDTLKNELKELTGNVVDIRVFEVKRPEIEARLVAEGVASQCERRVHPKRAAGRAIDSAKDTGMIQGIMIQVKGRIRGAEIARTETVKWGNVPRHTLRADIDYSFVEANVPAAGKHGIKVWIYKGEKTSYEIPE